QLTAEARIERNLRLPAFERHAELARQLFADLRCARTLVDRLAACVEGDNIDRGRLAGRNIDAARQLALLVDAELVAQFLAQAWNGDADLGAYRARRCDVDREVLLER